MNTSYTSGSFNSPSQSQVCLPEAKCSQSCVPTSTFQYKFQRISERICIGFLIMVSLAILSVSFIYRPLGYGLLALGIVPSFLYMVGSFYLQARKEFTRWNFEHKYKVPWDTDSKLCERPVERDSKEPFYEAYTVMDKLNILEKKYNIPSLQFYMMFKDDNLNGIVDTLTAVEWMGLIYKFFELGEADLSKLNEESTSNLDLKGE